MSNIALPFRGYGIKCNFSPKRRETKCSCNVKQIHINTFLRAKEKVHLHGWKENGKKANTEKREEMGVKWKVEE